MASGTSFSSQDGICGPERFPKNHNAIYTFDPHVNFCFPSTATSPSSSVFFHTARFSLSMSSEISFEHFDPRVELGNAVNDNGQVVRPRKKPGRKPNPPSPAQRKAQNRAAQRAFRERKRQEMREAEMTVKRCLYMRDQALQEANTLRQKVGELKFENNFLKGQLLTFKLACVANRVDVPKFYDANTTDAFGSETLSFSRTRGIPQALDFFLDSQQRIISFGDELDEKSLARPNHVTQGSQEQQQERRESVESVRQGQEPTSHLDVASVAPQLATHLQSSFFQQLLSTDLVPNNLPSSAVKDDAMDVDLSAYLNDLTPEEDKDHTNDSNEDEKQSASCPSFSSTSSTTSSSHDSSSLHSDASQDAHLATSAIQNWLSSATDESSEEPTTPTQSFHPMTSRDAVEHLRILKNMSKDSMSLYTPSKFAKDSALDGVG